MCAGGDEKVNLLNISVWQFCFQQLPGNVLVHLNIYDVEAYEFILGSFLWQMYSVNVSHNA